MRVVSRRMHTNKTVYVVTCIDIFQQTCSMCIVLVLNSLVYKYTKNIKKKQIKYMVFIYNKRIHFIVLYLISKYMFYMYDGGVMN